MLKKILLGLVLLASGPGFASLSALNTNNSYCNIADPIFVPDEDIDTISDSLVDSLLVHNEVYEKLCED